MNSFTVVLESTPLQDVGGAVIAAGAVVMFYAIIRLKVRQNSIVWTVGAVLAVIGSLRS